MREAVKSRISFRMGQLPLSVTPWCRRLSDSSLRRLQPLGLSSTGTLACAGFLTVASMWVYHSSENTGGKGACATGLLPLKIFRRQVL